MPLQTLITQPTIPISTVPKTALILDDCEFDRRRIQRLNSKLDCPLILEEVPDINSMNNCLNAQPFDLIMIDYGLGKENGLSALDLIQRHKLNQDAAKIMITGNTEASVAVSALKRGCIDYVSKRTLTPELFQKSVYDALKLARPDAVTNSLSVQDVLQQALRDGELQEVMRQSVRAAMSEKNMAQTVTVGTFDTPDSLQLLLLDLMDEDNFIFR